jgi:hypothetical protein
LLLTAPTLAQPVIRAARAALHPDTNKIVFVYGTNKKMWQEALSQDFTNDELPPELGGTKIYTNPYVTSLDDY